MSMGEKIESAIRLWRRRKLEKLPGPLGEYHRAGGNELLFSSLPIESADVVLDVGGFRGEWTAEVLVRYGCRSTIYEPVPEFTRALEERFGRNDRVRVVPAGLWKETTSLRFGMNQDGTSAFADSAGPSSSLAVQDVAAVFEEHAKDPVACMKINIEGAEYDVLERMIERDLLGLVGCFLIQFHPLPGPTDARREAIRAALGRTHACGFHYPYVWERWDRRGSPPRSPKAG